jgi:RNA-directed DNA polymerase
MGKTIMQMKARTQEEVIDKINPMLRGFANYYRGVVSKETFSYIENRSKPITSCLFQTSWKKEAKL